MKILFLTSGRRVPSSRFRVLQYVPHLERLGHECIVAPSRPEKYSSYRWAGRTVSRMLRRRHRYRDLRFAERGRFDVILLERELFSDETYDIEQGFRKIARTMLLDVDDAIFLLHPEKFDAVVRMCDVVIAGNELLCQKVRPLNNRVMLIPTCIDLERYRLQEREPDETSSLTFPNGQRGDSPPLDQSTPRTSRPWRLGWTGTSANLQYLSVIQGSLKELAKRYSIELWVITESQRALRQLDLRGVNVRFVRWNERTEIEDLRQFDLGLMPMPDTEWTRYKCGLKILQYMALGIPTIASPVGVNSSIVCHEKNGFCAASSHEWTRVLESLMEEPGQCQQIIAAGRRTVEQGFSVQMAVSNLVATFESAIAARG